MRRQTIPKEWIEEYFRKSGDEVLNVTNLLVTDFGFASYDVFPEEGILWIYSVYGDGKRWREFFTELGRSLGVKKLRFASRRTNRVRAFERAFGFRPVATVFELEL